MLHSRDCRPAAVSVRLRLRLVGFRRRPPGLCCCSGDFGKPIGVTLSETLAKPGLEHSTRLAGPSCALEGSNVRLPKHVGLGLAAAEKPDIGGQLIEGVGGVGHASGTEESKRSCPCGGQAMQATEPFQHVLVVGEESEVTDSGEHDCSMGVAEPIPGNVR